MRLGWGILMVVLALVGALCVPFSAKAGKVLDADVIAKVMTAQAVDMVGQSTTVEAYTLARFAHGSEGTYIERSTELIMSLPETVPKASSRVEIAKAYRRNTDRVDRKHSLLMHSEYG